MAEASEFKFGRLLRFAKTHHKIPPRSKEGRNPELGELPKIGFSLNIYAVSYTHLTLPTNREV